MTGYLSHNIQVGDRMKLTPTALLEGTMSSEQVRDVPCVVKSIPRHGRFATVEFTLEKGKTFCECWPIEPDEQLVLHKEQTEDKKVRGKNRSKVPIVQQIQAGKWDGMTVDQIAKELGVSRAGVDAALRKMKKQGIQISYKRGKSGWPKRRPQKQATCALKQETHEEEGVCIYGRPTRATAEL